MRSLALALALGAFAPTASADLLVLKDGRVIQDQKLARSDGGIAIQYANGDVLVPTALVEDVIIDGEATPPPATAEEQEMAGKGLVRWEGKWIPKKRRDELLAKRTAERKKEVEEIAAHREWAKRRTAKTKHFAFEYTVPQGVFENYAALMEAYFDAFVKDWGLQAPKNLGQLPVCLHIDYDAMVQVGGAGNGVLGYFRFVRPWDLNFFHDRTDPAFTEEVMFHETNHYLQKLLDLEFAMPHFPGESLAEYYGASHWDPVKKKLSTGLLLEGRLCELKLDLQRGEWIGLEQLVSTDRMYEHYNWGWSLVYFLMKDPRYQKKFQKFVATLPSGKGIQREVMGVDNLKTVSGAEVWKTFKAELGLKDAAAVTALEKEWHEFVDKKLQLESYRGLETAARQASNNGQPIKAKRLFKEAIERGSTNPLTFHGYAELLARDGEHDQAIELWRKALAIDPLNAECYAAMGRSLLARGDKKEASRLRRLARDIDPDNSWFLFTDEDLEEIGTDDPPKK
ncbi:MAG: hypothetical protein IT453_20485 [Planctomycetes bacterium]|nr:hypothetical protein [Planctomycetota bacterium]